MSEVVPFAPAAARRAAAAARRAAPAEPRRRRTADAGADAWVSAAGPAPAPAAWLDPLPMTECIGQLQRDCAVALRAPLERHVAGLGRLAACRTPEELAATQLALAQEAAARGFEDAARVAESWARLHRATARLMTGGWF
ncbi:MAG: phasin family protein [Salinarimonas sp.]